MSDKRDVGDCRSLKLVVGGAGVGTARRRENQSEVPRSARSATMKMPSPRSVYQVRPSRNSMVSYSTLRSLTAVRCRTLPSESTIAVNPVGAACTTHRPFSIARSLLEATCWVCTIVPV